MGKLSRGFLGGFQGQLGTAYGCFWRLMDLIKAMPRKSNKPPTPKQLNVQLRWALITDFLSWLAPVIKVGYQNKPSNQSAMNAAVSYNVKNAVTGVAPNYMIDFTKLQLSEGVLEEASGYTVSTAIGSKLEISWLASAAGAVNSYVTDKVSIVVYNLDKHKFVMLKDVATRDDLEFTVQLPLDYAGDTVHCYLTMTREDDKMVSVSQYAGNFIIL